MLWHLARGIEADVEALISPTQLPFALSGGLIVGEPLRAAWNQPRRETRAGWSELAMARLSLGFTLSLFAGSTDFAKVYS